MIGEPSNKGMKLTKLWRHGCQNGHAASCPHWPDRTRAPLRSLSPVFKMAISAAGHRAIGIRDTLRKLKNAGLVDEDSLHKGLAPQEV